MLGASLTAPRCRKAAPDMLALKPYWGKPAVRNFREDDGDVGIIEARSAPSSYPTRKSRRQEAVEVSCRLTRARNSAFRRRTGSGLSWWADSGAWLHRFYHNEGPFLLPAAAQVTDVFVTSRLEAKHPRHLACDLGTNGRAESLDDRRHGDGPRARPSCPPPGSLRTASLVPEVCGTSGPTAAPPANVHHPHLARAPALLLRLQLGTPLSTHPARP